MKKLNYLKIGLPLLLTIYLIISCGKESPTESISPPSAPSGVSAFAGDGEVTISWDPVSGSTSYNLYWATAPGVTPTTGTQIPNVTSPYTHTGLTNGTIYYYIVAAVNDGGEGPASDEVSATPGAPATPPILDDISNPDGDGYYTVSWSAVDRATSYTLEEDDNDTFSSPSTVYLGSNTSEAITGRDVGKYYYRVKAWNTFGHSSWSNVVSVQVTQAGIVPEPGTWYGYSGSLTIRFTVSSDSRSVSNGRMTASCGSKSIAGPAAIENSSFTLMHSDSINFISATFDEVDKAHGSFGFWKSSSCWAIGTVIFSH